MNAGLFHDLEAADAANGGQTFAARHAVKSYRLRAHTLDEVYDKLGVPCPALSGPVRSGPVRRDS